MACSTYKFVTGNKNKLKEVQQILGQHYQIDNVEIDLDECQGDVEYIARKKCEDAARIVFASLDDNVKGVLTEDTCLAFNAHGGLPGPYIKFYLQKMGVNGLPKMLTAFDDKSAQAVCTFALAERYNGNITVKLFQGTTDGEIVAPRGSKNFGWDSIFQPKGTSQTFAEMTAEQKNAISHRSRSLALLKGYLDRQCI